MFKKIIVTGSTGFIGSSLASYLSSLGHQVFGIDRISNQSNQKDDNFYSCDLLEIDKLKSIFKTVTPEIVFHLAARTDLNEKENLSGYASNIEGVENLILAIQETPSIQRAIFTSSQLVCKVGYVPKDDRDYCPNTLYGESKVLTEKIVRQYQGGGVEWCIVRPTTVWGPGMSPHYQSFLKMIDQGLYFHIGNKPLYKSYSYIGNITYQYDKLMQAPVEEIYQKTFYLADYHPLSLREWTNLIQKELGAKPIPTYPESMVRLVAFIGDLINQMGWQDFPFNSFRYNNILTEYLFDMSETQKVCGILPYDLERGVKELANWVKLSQII